MSRHRIVRTMDYNDEYDGYDDVYGHSVDDDHCISPTDAQQWLYDRERGRQSISAFISKNKDIKEEGEHDEDDEDEAYEKARRDSESFQMPELDEMEQAKLSSCVDEVRSVVGDAVSERRIVETSMKFDYDIQKILDEILNEETKKSAKPALRPKVPVPIAATTVKSASKPTPPAKISLKEPRRGFEIASPKLPSSPVVSGRNTPVDVGGDNDLSRTSASVFKVSKDQAQRNAQQLYEKERSDQKSHIHMIVIGHVDAGKSTLMGHLLYDTGNVSQRVMHKHEQESKKLGKQSFMYAWVLDETGEERARGITMDVGQSRIETKTKIVTLLDAPGHKDFIPNMISGATQADVALLVVDATRGEFESGFELGGQTREHAILVRSLGVNQLGVVINKLDTVGWSQERFTEIVTKLKSFLKQAGFKESDVSFTPCSGLTGENLTKKAQEAALTSWYSGRPLLDVIENFKIPERALDRPLRMSVSDIYKGTGSGFCISGRVETGVMCVNDKVLVGASREQAQVKSLTMDEFPQTSVFAGDQIAVTLAGVDINNITVGCIISDPQTPIPVTTRFQARIIVFSVKVPITMGFPVLLHHQSLIEPAVVCKLTASIHKSTGEVVKKKPRCLGSNSCALVELETSRPICIERYADFKELGRVMLRVAGVTIAAGMVTKIR
ncbi:HBS1-like protein isoform X1 [Drosophila subobscura]|uniref:HBS1-like protein isoform X1 n=1 Tax=Drosophila subobscura TaxID=7241 RepID=UPI00155AA3E6|nr:HBS1-like protein isoform X1 [Drosophila subobscura]